MRADDEGRVPVPTQRIFVAADFRSDAMTLSGRFVVANQIAVLKLGIDRVRIFRIYLGAETVAALGDPPIAVDDARRVARARRSAEGKVVLCAGEHVVERGRIVSRHIVELRDRQVALEVPVRTAVPTLVYTAVTTDEVMFVVVRVDPDLVIINVL